METHLLSKLRIHVHQKGHVTFRDGTAEPSRPNLFHSILNVVMVILKRPSKVFHQSISV